MTGKAVFHGHRAAETRRALASSPLSSLLWSPAALLLLLRLWQLLRACQQGCCRAVCTTDMPGVVTRSLQTRARLLASFAILFCALAQLAAAERRLMVTTVDKFSGHSHLISLPILSGLLDLRAAFYTTF